VSVKGIHSIVAKPKQHLQAREYGYKQETQANNRFVLVADVIYFESFHPSVDW
jgi:hypothetical protein